MDKQRTLGQLMRSFVKRNMKDWEEWISHVFNTTTSYSPFELAYGFNPLSSLAFFPLPSMPNCDNNEGLSKAQFGQELHDKAKLHMERKGEQYGGSANKGRKEVLFKERDLIWVHWRKYRFPHLRKSKFLPRGDEKINDNVYQVDMPPNFEGSTIFIVIDLTAYDASGEESNLRENSLQEGEDDAYTKRADPTLEVTQGRLRRIQEEVQHQLTTLKDHEEGTTCHTLYYVSSCLEGI
ncbi:hypothetical protein CR513_20479, partial [Mucuna pruriens]